MNGPRSQPIGAGRRAEDNALALQEDSTRVEEVVKGRGATLSPAPRYDALSANPIDDGWDSPDDAPSPVTELTVEHPRKIITYNESPDVPFDRSINPYRGCEHGCVYCFARPTHAWLGLSPGLDFETRLHFKPSAADLLRRELSAPGYAPKPIGLGTNTDPWQPVERRLSISSAILAVLSACGHPATIVTKSAGILRDLPVLTDMAQRNLVRVHISLTTLNVELSRRMEPRASSPAKRLAAIEALSKAGVPVATLIAPMIPGLNDAELEALMHAAASAGARDAGFVLLRLPLEVAPIFESWLRRHYPDRAEKVLKLVRETRGGRLYDSRYGKRMAGEGVYASLLARRYALARRRLGFGRMPPLDCSAFAPPARSTVRETGQMSLF
ncbi:PA0069 family radical SAM protein [Acetobacter sacchari]|uniref:PA0069 family radical SAM protein n=1 Tax=Acetobacter sacchari TaxID=2661687 RepID=A0ABS3LU29_9PROT|nr:PA0069 family radical SAM protein [Acetobacter sacchari]MBO1359396.1 PA0069 family radical SAM protein [Acetobacter sacchari]